MKAIRSNMSKLFVGFCLLFFVVFCWFLLCEGADFEVNEYDYLLDEIFEDNTVNEAVEEVFGDKRLNVRQIIEQLLSGEGTVFEILMDLIKDRFNGVGSFKNLLIKLLSLAVICAMFGFLPQILGNEQSSQMGHFISFIILAAFLISMTHTAVTIVTDSIDVIIFLMNVFIPTYLVSLALSGGISTAAWSYEFFQVIIYGVQKVILNFLCPFVMIYLAMGLANQLLESDKFSKITDLIKKAIGWVLKGILTLLVGVQLLQGLITPYVDKFNTSVARKTIEAIPAVGDVATSGIEIAVGAAMLIKNSIGVVGIIILLAVVATPILELLSYTVALVLVNALLQPVLDSRVQKILDTAVNTMKMLLFILLTVMLLFLISIALLATKQ